MWYNETENKQQIILRKGNTMFYIGCHLSVSQGYEAMGRTALSLGANTFQYFTRNPRGRGFRRPAREDVLALVNVCPRPFSVVAKKEVANVQFLKQVFACMKAYMIDRCSAHAQ